MDAASKGSRLTPIRIGAALVVAAVLSLGATACGSSSDSESSESASNVPNKEAGGLPTQEAGGVATVPKLATVPRLHAFEAFEYATQAGFSTVDDYVEGNPGEDCGGEGDAAYVVDQSPQPGTEASTDQPIKLTILECEGDEVVVPPGPQDGERVLTPDCRPVLGRPCP
jgi:hypothetical protein